MRTGVFSSRINDGTVDDVVAEPALQVDEVPTDATLQVRVGLDPGLAENEVNGRLFALLHRAQIPYAEKTSAFAAATAPAPLTNRLSRLQALRLDPLLETALSELLLARPAAGQG